jgi:hypothetical protein
MHKEEVDTEIKEMKDLIEENNIPKIKGINPTKKLKDFIENEFSKTVKSFTDFYEKYNEDKTDLDNLLKSSKFSEAFELKIEELTSSTIKNLISQNEYNSQ